MDSDAPNSCGRHTDSLEIPSKQKIWDEWTTEKSEHIKNRTSTDFPTVIPSKADNENLTLYTISGQAVAYTYALFLHDQKGHLYDFRANHRSLRSDGFNTSHSISGYKSNEIIKHLQAVDQHDDLNRAKYDLAPYQIPPMPKGPVDGNNEYLSDSGASGDVVLLKPILHKDRKFAATEGIKALSLNRVEARKLYTLVSGVNSEPACPNDTDDSQCALLFLQAALNEMSAVSMGVLYLIILDGISAEKVAKSKQNWAQASILVEVDVLSWLFAEIASLLQVESPIRFAVIDGLHRIFAMASVCRGKIPSSADVSNNSLPLTKALSLCAEEEPGREQLWISSYWKAVKGHSTYECVMFIPTNAHLINSEIISNDVAWKLRERSYKLQCQAAACNACTLEQTKLLQVKPTEELDAVLNIVCSVSQEAKVVFGLDGELQKKWKDELLDIFLDKYKLFKIDNMPSFKNHETEDTLPLFLRTMKCTLSNANVNKASVPTDSSLSKVWAVCVYALMFWFAPDKASSMKLHDLLCTRGGDLSCKLDTFMEREDLDSFSVFWPSKGIRTQKRLFDMVGFIKKFFLWILSDLFDAITGSFQADRLVVNKHPIAKLRFTGNKRVPATDDTAVFDHYMHMHIAEAIVDVYSEFGFFAWNESLDPLVPKDIKIPEGPKKKPWNVIPHTFMKTHLVLVILATAIKEDHLEPSIDLKRDTHFTDGNVQGKHKMKRRYTDKCQIKHFKPELSWSSKLKLSSDMPEKKSISDLAALLLNDDKVTIGILCEAFSTANIQQDELPAVIQGEQQQVCSSHMQQGVLPAVDQEDQQQAHASPASNLDAVSNHECEKQYLEPDDREPDAIAEKEAGVDSNTNSIYGGGGDDDDVSFSGNGGGGDFLDGDDEPHQPKNLLLPDDPSPGNQEQSVPSTVDQGDLDAASKLEQRCHATDNLEPYDDAGETNGSTNGDLDASTTGSGDDELSPNHEDEMQKKLPQEDSTFEEKKLDELPTMDHGDPQRTHACRALDAVHKLAHSQQSQATGEPEATAYVDEEAGIISNNANDSLTQYCGRVKRKRTPTPIPTQTRATSKKKQTANSNDGTANTLDGGYAHSETWEPPLLNPPQWDPPQWDPPQWDPPQWDPPQGAFFSDTDTLMVNQCWKEHVQNSPAKTICDKIVVKLKTERCSIDVVLRLLQSSDCSDAWEAVHKLMMDDDATSLIELLREYEVKHSL